MERELKYKIPVYIIMVMEWLFFFEVVLNPQPFTWYNLIPRIFGAANVYAAGFLLAHELFHKEDKVDKYLGTLHLIKCCYLHFAIEHVHGHHKNVSTPLDPASA